ncbi:MAG: nucleoside triphosphate pyrophosphohydrolase [bacterium]|nr:nucleoside triphosphate pyrophosphohydrolase [bacterium]
MEEKVFNKLVRDRIPEIIEGNGEIAVTRILDEAEYKLELEKKLLEECNEVLSAVRHDEIIEELADVLEVLGAIGALEGVDLEKIISVMNSKREKRGGFSQKIFLEKTMK